MVDFKNMKRCTISLVRPAGEPREEVDGYMWAEPRRGEPFVFYRTVADRKDFIKGFTKSVLEVEKEVITTLSRNFYFTTYDGAQFRLVVFHD